MEEVSALLNAARCFRCIPQGEQDAVAIYEGAAWANGGADCVALLQADVAAWPSAQYTCFGGDSIPAGAPTYQNPYNGGPAGDIDHDVSHRLFVTSGFVTANNVATPGWEWSNVLAAIIRMTISQSKYFVAHCGVNDVFNGRTWAAVEADLNGIKTACDAAGTIMILDEIWPDTNFTAPQNAVLATFNANYATWCAGSGAILMQSHDAMGVGPGFTTLNPVYDFGDGVHPSNAGIQKWAEIVYAELLELECVP